MSEREGYLVAAFKPFWRYAVALPNRPDLAAIPFWTKAGALAERDILRAELPWTRPILLRHRFFRGVEEVAARQPEGRQP